MEDQRFDDLVKRLCTTRLTRMSVLRGLAAGAVAAVAGVKVGAGRSVSAAAGTCRNLGHPCEGNQDCCAGIEFCDVTGPGNAKRCVSTPNCGGLSEACCAENTCDLGLECNGTICVDPDTECGAIGQQCCDGTGSDPNFCDPGGVCDETQGPNGTCV